MVLSWLFRGLFVVKIKHFRYMKNKIYVLLFCAAMSLSLSAQTYHNGTWYSLYDDSEHTMNTQGDYSTGGIFAPTAGKLNTTRKYEWVDWLGFSRKVNTEVLESADNGSTTIIVGMLAEHTDKKVLKHALGKYICVKFLSINETYEKASRSYESTLAVFKLTEILKNATLIEELPAKRNTRNQKQFEKLLVMQYENIKLTVGLQRSNQNLVQYCITVPQIPIQTKPSTQC